MGAPSPERPRADGDPPPPGPPDVTEMLAAWVGGDRAALDRLIPIVYDELRRIARAELRREAPGHTLDTVAVVNEAYLKLAGQGDVEWRSRAHFFAIAARAIRTILIDHARARRAGKRGGGVVAVTLDRIADQVPAQDPGRLLALHDALGRLADVDADAARMVECRYFAGLNLDEIAEVLGTSVATTRRRWAFARAWLRRELSAVE